MDQIAMLPMSNSCPATFPKQGLRPDDLGSKHARSRHFQDGVLVPVALRRERLA